MRNQYSREMRAMIEQAREQGFYMGLQTATDAHAMAINDLYHIGPGRYPELHAKAGEYINEIAALICDDTKDIEYTKAVIDRRLVEVVGEENFVPYDERYDYGVRKEERGR